MSLGVWSHLVGGMLGGGMGSWEEGLKVGTTSRLSSEPLSSAMGFTCSDSEGELYTAPETFVGQRSNV